MGTTPLAIATTVAAKNRERAFGVMHDGQFFRRAGEGQQVPTRAQTAHGVAGSEHQQYVARRQADPAHRLASHAAAPFDAEHNAVGVAVQMGLFHRPADQLRTRCYDRFGHYQLFALADFLVCAIALIGGFDCDIAQSHQRICQDLSGGRNDHNVTAAKHDVAEGRQQGAFAALNHPHRDVLQFREESAGSFNADPGVLRRQGDLRNELLSALIGHALGHGRGGPDQAGHDQDHIEGADRGQE